MTESPETSPGFGDCGFCGFTYYGRPSQCRRCGNLLNEAAEDAKRRLDDRFKRISWQKARSDTLFLVGLLLGGPMMAVGSTFRIGIFVALAGAISSVIRRYSDWSMTGTVVVGSAFALIAATWFVDPPPHGGRVACGGVGACRIRAGAHGPLPRCLRRDAGIRTRGGLVHPAERVRG